MRLLEYRARFTQIVNDSNYWLLAIALGLVVLHLQLYWRLSGDFSHLSLEMVEWSALGYSLWQKRDRLLLKREKLSQCVGWFLIALLLVRGLNYQVGYTLLLEVTPLFIGGAIGLIAVGFRQFKYYRRELWIILVMVIPIHFLMVISESLVDSSVVTAKYAHTLMWYLGFLVERQGTKLIMPTGAVQVYLGCSGLEAILVTLKVAALFLLIFPTTSKQKITVPAIAILSAFIINGFRVMFLAYLVSKKDTASFDYWHGTGGAQVFSMISMTIFTSYCQYLVEYRKLEPEASIEATETPEELEHSSH
ncbi:cyanoexosortase A [Cyanobacteria bacterium FACHB-DQ100]|nr:cyanoexosortase A [Cyanobacteria bacterium FACHB-DQ100]